jgi:flagellar biosynthesis/type III secretory pathway M-ring protein FliF/YscJ
MDLYNNVAVRLLLLLIILALVTIFFVAALYFNRKPPSTPVLIVQLDAEEVLDAMTEEDWQLAMTEEGSVRALDRLDLVQKVLDVIEDNSRYYER